MAKQGGNAACVQQTARLVLRQPAVGGQVKQGGGWFGGMGVLQQQTLVPGEGVNGGQGIWRWLVITGTEVAAVKLRPCEVVGSVLQPQAFADIAVNCRDPFL